MQFGQSDGVLIFSLQAVDGTNFAVGRKSIEHSIVHKDGENDMTGNYSEEMGAVKSDLQTLKEDLATLTKSVKADAQANALELRANAKTKLDEARANAMEAGTKGRKKAQATIKDNPIVSIAATAGIGLIVGALMARR